MAGLSYPFDAGPGSTITEDQWSYLVKDSLGNGVHEDANAPYSGELEVYTIAEPGIVRVRAGRATINGFHYQQGGEEIIAVTANANVTMDRIDAIVLRLDLSTDAITLETKLGVPASSPVAPAIDSNELALATMTVPKNSNTVTTVVDLRVFVGRRMLIDKGDPNVGKRGDLIYSYFADRWSGMREDGFADQLAFKSEIDDHVAASNPHPQYLLEDGATVVSASSGIITAAPLVTTFGAYCRGLRMPGGDFWIVHLSLNIQWNGTDNPGMTTLVTINPPELRPNFTLYTPAHQYEFSNSTDDIPLVVGINPSGNINAGSLTQMQGGARLIINTMYFTGPGV